jgi:hypothetical protein
MTASEGINRALDVADDLAGELLSLSGDDLVTVPAGIRDALKKLAAELESRVTTIRQIGGRA